MPKTDPQQHRVYRMESEAIGSKRYADLPLKSLRRFARAVCRLYGMPQVEVQFADLGPWGGEWMHPNIIRLNRRKSGARDLLTLAHELAHHLHEHLVPDNLHQAHGPEFMGCYLSVLDATRMIPVVGMRAICDNYKIRYVDPGVRNNNIATLRKRVSRGLPSSPPR